MQEQQTSQFNLNFLRSIGLRIYFMVIFALGMLALVLVLNSASSNQVAENLEQLETLREPTLATSSEAEIAMLRMLINIRGYLALGDPAFITQYEAALSEFEEDIASLDALSVSWTNPENKTRLANVEDVFEEWVLLPQQMFDLRDDPIANEPAQALLVNEGAPRIASVQADITAMIDIQALREPSAINIELLKDMADYRGSWNAMAAGIRGYLANLNPSFLDEYNAALAINTDAWERLLAHPRSVFTNEQITARDSIAVNREAFLVFPQQMFDAATSDHAREDLFLLNDKAVPQAGTILENLDLMVRDQEGLLRSDINLSEETLATGQQTNLLVGGAALGISALLSFFIINSITQPLGVVTRAAQAVARGDRDVHVDITSGDEIGVLASSFNTMTDELNASYEGLEERVAERTRDMQTVVEVSNQISTILDMDRLLQDVVDITKERFGLYHTHIYMLDDEGQTLVLTAGAGHVGRQMVAEYRIIDFSNRQSVVATAARDRQSVVFNDVASSPTFLAHPLLPNTKSEVALPLIARGNVLGVLDVQGDEVGYFTEENMNVLEILSNQIATALSNTALFETSDRISRHERALGAIDRQIQQAIDVDEVLQIAVRELGKALRVPYTAIELQMTTESNNSEIE